MIDALLLLTIGVSLYVLSRLLRPPVVRHYQVDGVQLRPIAEQGLKTGEPRA